MTYKHDLEEQQEEDSYDPYWDAPVLELLPPITALEVAMAAQPTPPRPEPLTPVLPAPTSGDRSAATGVRDLCVKKIGFYSDELIVEVSKDKTKVRIERNVVNVGEALKLHPELSRNAYSYSVLCQEEKINGQAVSDETIIELIHKLTRIFRRHVSKDTVCTALSRLCNENKVNEVKSYFEGLPPTTTRVLDTWLTTFLGVEDSELVRVLGRKWLISAVARAYQPGCHIEGMLVLEGAGGTGKSYALKTLCPREEWFSSSKLDFANEKETAEKLRGIFLHENAELAGLSRADQNVVKAWATNQRDIYRAAYDRKSKTVPRMMVSAGSTNDETYLADRTGENRRFWGVKTGTINIDALLAAKEGLWREAVDAYKAGGSARLWTLTPDEIKLLGESNDERMILDTTEEHLRMSLAGADKVSSSELANTHLHNKKFAPKDLPNVMRRLGYIQDRYYEEGKQVRGYILKTQSH